MEHICTISEENSTKLTISVYVICYNALIKAKRRSPDGV